MHVQLHQSFPLKYSIRTRENPQLFKFIWYMFNVITVYVLLRVNQNLFCVCFLTYILLHNVYLCLTYMNTYT